MESLRELLVAILSSPEFAAFLVTAVVAIATWIGKSVRDLLNRKLTSEQLKLLMVIAENSVRVAEQTGLGKTGEEKKAEALAVAQTYLDAYGIKVSAAQLSAAVEAAVFSELTQFKQLEAVDVDELVEGQASDEAPEA